MTCVITEGASEAGQQGPYLLMALIMTRATVAIMPGRYCTHIPNHAEACMYVQYQQLRLHTVISAAACDSAALICSAHNQAGSTTSIHCNDDVTMHRTLGKHWQVHT